MCLAACRTLYSGYVAVEKSYHVNLMIAQKVEIRTVFSRMLYVSDSFSPYSVYIEMSPDVSDNCLEVLDVSAMNLRTFRS